MKCWVADANTTHSVLRRLRSGKAFLSEFDSIERLRTWFNHEIYPKRMSWGIVWLTETRNLTYAHADGSVTHERRAGYNWVGYHFDWEGDPGLIMLEEMTIAQIQKELHP